MPARLRALLAVMASVVSLVIGAVAAPAATAWDIHPISPLGFIDTAAVQYDNGDPASYSAVTIHVTGWAVDLHHPTVNGSGSQMWVYFTAQGSDQTIGVASAETYMSSRPDVARAYPGVGADQGFDVLLTAPHTGRFTFCAHLLSMLSDGKPSPDFACKTIVIPSTPPKVATSLSGRTVAGSTVTLTTSASTGGTESYYWKTYASGNWWISFPAPPKIVTGETGASLALGPSYVGRYLEGWVVSRIDADTTLEFGTGLQPVSYPDTVTPTRVSGNDRYGTSVAASERAFPDSAAGVLVAYLASGIAFPDALSAGAAAAHRGATLLLTPPGRLDDRVAAELVRLHPATVIVAGGPAAVSDAVLAEAGALAFHPTVLRISGSDRYETSRRIVDDAFGSAAAGLYVVTGTNYPDALTAATAGAITGRPVLLVNGYAATPDSATTSALARWGTTHVTVVGGTASVPAGIASGLGAGVAVSRLAGANRFDTAAEVARSLPAGASVSIATGSGFADALTAAVVAGPAKAPLLLAGAGCLPDTAIAAMMARSTSAAIEVGGDQVVSDVTWQYAC